MHIAKNLRIFLLLTISLLSFFSIEKVTAKNLKCRHKDNSTKSSFSTRDFEGDWAVVGTSIGGITGSGENYSFAALFNVHLDSKGNGDPVNYIKTIYTGDSEPYKIIKNGPSKMELRLIDCDFGSGTVTLKANTVNLGQQVHLIYAFIVTKVDKRASPIEFDFILFEAIGADGKPFIPTGLIQFKATKIDTVNAK